MFQFPSQGIFPTQGSNLCLQLSRQILYHWATWEAHISGLLFSHSVISDCLRPHGLQHARLPCPSIFPRVAQTHVHWVEMPSNCLILCCPLLLLPSIFPNIRVFSNESTLHIRWPKFWASASTLVLPMNIQGWFPLGLTGLISLQSKELSRIFSSTTVWRHQLFSAWPFSIIKNKIDNVCEVLQKRESS